MEEHRRRTDKLEEILENHIKEEGGKYAELMDLIKYNNSITEGLVHNVSAVGSDLQAFKKEMKPWLEAKIGLNLVWRWAIGIPVIIGVLLSIKTLLAWLGFHR